MDKKTRVKLIGCAIGCLSSIAVLYYWVLPLSLLSVEEKDLPIMLSAAIAVAAFTCSVCVDLWGWDMPSKSAVMVALVLLPVIFFIASDGNVLAGLAIGLLSTAAGWLPKTILTLVLVDKQNRAADRRQAEA